MPKIPGGFYIKARKIQESKIQRQPPHVREIWDWLLKEANHKDKKYNGFIVKRGQLFRTYQDIREGLHWMVGYRKMMYNENQTKKAMKFLREHLMIATSKELGGVLITILNYNHYQNPKNYERTKERTNERTNEEPMKNHPLPDNNKNVKNVNNNNPLFCQKDFDKFWLLYPIKREKKDVLVLWKKMLKSNKLPKVDILITAIQNQTEWRKNASGEFRPDWKYPIRWLKKQCWEDEITQEPEIEAPKATQAGDPWVYDN